MNNGSQKEEEVAETVADKVELKSAKSEKKGSRKISREETKKRRRTLTSSPRSLLEQEETEAIETVKSPHSKTVANLEEKGEDKALVFGRSPSKVARRKSGNRTHPLPLSLN